MKPNFKAINQVVADAIQEEKNAFSAYDLGKAHAALGKKPENLQTPNTKSHSEYEKGYRTGMGSKKFNESVELDEAILNELHDYPSTRKMADDAYDEMTAASKKLNSYPKGSMGMTPDDVKKSPEYQTDMGVYNKAANKSKIINAHMMKHFKKEHQAAYAAKRGMKTESEEIKYEYELSEDKDAKKVSKPAAAPDEDGAEVEAQSKSKALEFERTHVPSGKTTLSKFNKSHHWILGTGESEGETDEDDYSTEPEKSRMKEAKKLVDKWNTISPDTWKYKLKSKSVNESEDDTLDEAKDTKKAPDESDENEFMKKDAKKFKSVAEGIMRRVVDKMDLAEPNTPYKKIIKDVVKDTASGIKDDTKAMINVAGKKSVEGWEYVKSNLQHLKQK